MNVTQLKNVCSLLAREYKTSRSSCSEDLFQKVVKILEKVDQNLGVSYRLGNS